VPERLVKATERTTKATERALETTDRNVEVTERALETTEDQPKRRKTNQVPERTLKMIARTTYIFKD